jgi:hypothetical protein
MSTPPTIAPIAILVFMLKHLDPIDAMFSFSAFAFEALFLYLPSKPKVKIRTTRGFGDM